MSLTDREFWLNYWENHRHEINTLIPQKLLFDRIFEALFADGRIKSTCELGGFPGTFSLYLHRRYGVDATFTDYVIPRHILDEFLQVNGEHPDTIKAIEADIFSYQPEKTYDMVFSVGLIEHFEDTADVISRHLPYMHDGSTLLLLLPNFRGLNGWFQRKFDRANYDKHHIPCMDPAFLADVCRKLDLTEVKAGYYGKFGIWLERESAQPLPVRLLKKLTWLTGKVITRLIPVESRLFSPYIVVTAVK